MNVCFVAQQSITMVGGGPATQVRETARHLASEGVKVSFFNQWEPFDPERFDLVHIFGANSMTYDIALRMEHFRQRFVVSSIFFTLHRPWAIRATRAAERLLKRFASGLSTDYGVSSHICRMAEAALPNTRSEGKILSEGFGVDPRRITVVPNGVDARFADADPSLFVRTYGVRDFILNVGHIGSRRKNVLALIRALASIDVPAVIVGKVHEGEYGRACLEEARRNPNITIIEGLANDSAMLASAYAACRVFALPSLFETPGIAALEAGLAGARICITRYGGTDDYFGDRAVYVDPHSVSSIREGIERSLARSDTAGLREHIRENFLWPSVAKKTAEVYRNVLRPATSLTTSGSDRA